MTTEHGSSAPNLSRNATGPTFYGADLSQIHHMGFTSLASGAAPAIVEALRSAGFSHGPIVELGCGSGVLAGALIDAGHSVTGVDRSPAMLDLARRTAPTATFIESSLFDFEFPPCVAVLAVGEGLTYVGREDPADELPGLFERVYEALTPGGLFLFDLIVTSGRQPGRYSAERVGPDWRVSVEVTEFPERSLLVRQIRTVIAENGVGRASMETHRVRTFPRRRVEDLLRRVGFSVRVRRSYGRMALASNRLAFFARKAARGKSRRRSRPAASR